MSSQHVQFQAIKDFFVELDASQKSQGKKLVYDTDKGIFGTSDLDVVFEFLQKISPQSNDILVDLGGGDGRVAMVASLFCKAISVEYDADLANKSREYAKQLSLDIEVQCADYEVFDYSKVTILYSYADHFFTHSFIKKLQSQFSGSLYIYEGIFLPDSIKKGPKVWAKGTPLTSFDFNKE